MYYAHSAPAGLPWEPLREHLRDVAERAAVFAEPFGAADEARLAGLLHDLGKYSEIFTLRLQGREKGLDHWSLGAWAALTSCRSIAAALAIQGHHVGLGKGDRDALRELEPSRLRERHPLGLRLTGSEVSILMARLAADGLELPHPSGSLYDPCGPAGAGMLDVRMLFSALVDADYLETEAHFQRGPDGRKRQRPIAPDLQSAEALARLEARLAELAHQSQADPKITALRADLAAACLATADLSPGLFTLSAPTGAGKTLAMLAFALRHAHRHGLRRIVVAIPFLSILEQTARIYRDLLEPAFDERYLLEHHSLAGTHREPGEGRGETDAEEEARRIARWTTENWDAPLVVTTSVQILESLFSNRPSACRKLHRLARSVLLFDEVQTLPPALAVPTLAALSRLAERYGSTVVFSTATQPAFDHLSDRVGELAAPGWAPREIVPAELRLFERARRVRVVWEAEAPRSWESLAAELADAGTALCIVNLKRHAHRLAELLRSQDVPGLLHLSTNLCPAHRERVLDEVRRRLDAHEPCLLISTQCVEAGVDVDFPRVFRALAPLDAIAQAAGRCNRNGLLAEGLVRVFLPEEDGKVLYPPGGYAQGASATLVLLRRHGSEGMDIQSTELFREYYLLLYKLQGITEEDRGKARKLREAMEVRDFEQAAELYRLIDQDAVNVVVPYEPEAFAALDAELREAGRLTGGWIRRARRHTVSLYRPRLDAPVRRFLQPVSLGRGELSDDWFLYTEPEHYDRELLGLREAPDVWIA
jgi:CRISPR-associated helicase Cas3/CRISPR-associated endonuclease Cas3-HD